MVLIHFLQHLHVEARQLQQHIMLATNIYSNKHLNDFYVQIKFFNAMDIIQKQHLHKILQLLDIKHIYLLVYQHVNLYEINQ